eukprot:TRINITY_DN18047_c0_g1_i1.p1 TRINITY_DN18047_c0_g1~~TRINITY_DN18047_c0_g1_i1.p1  ORF type:complete len:434 (+),score=117.57 TRINITY_DN18047_c0_g1_i1:100-1302(+)
MSIFRQTKVLSDSGLEAIATHKYVGGKYTPLDNLFNPFWFWATGKLPLWMAPNLVTLIALAHGAIAYGALAVVSPELCGAPPRWVYLLCAYCLWAYETLDAMDGKQARRTGQSTPLGQLFDHGCDAAVNISHHAVAAAILGFACGDEFAAQLAHWGLLSLLFGFYLAQWQEYHTRVLPTSFGPVGVTETHWTMILLCVACYLWGTVPTHTIPALAGVPVVGELPANQVGLLGWAVFIGVLGGISVVSTLCDRQTNKLEALLQLLMPCVVVATAALLPADLVSNNLRVITLCTGFTMLRLTCEMIVFSMAHMRIPTLNGCVVLYALLCAAAHWRDLTAFYVPATGWRLDHTLTAGLLIYVLGDFALWTTAVIQQICGKLKIRCFHIPHAAPKRDRSVHKAE